MIKSNTWRNDLVYLGVSVGNFFMVSRILDQTLRFGSEHLFVVFILSLLLVALSGTLIWFFTSKLADRLASKTFKGFYLLILVVLYVLPLYFQLMWSNSHGGYFLALFTFVFIPLEFFSRITNKSWSVIKTQSDS